MNFLAADVTDNPYDEVRVVSFVLDQEHYLERDWA